MNRIVNLLIISVLFAASIGCSNGSGGSSMLPLLSNNPAGLYAAVSYRYYNYSLGDTIEASGYWKNSTWTRLGSQDDTKDKGCTSIFVSGSDVYVGGYNDLNVWSTGLGYHDVELPGYWKNGTFHACPTQTVYDPDTLQSSRVNSFLIDADGVFATGYKGDGTYGHLAAYWFNDTMNTFVSNGYSEVYSIYTDGSYRYFGGSRIITGVMTAGYWKELSWNGLTPLNAAKDSYCYDVTVSGSDVYAGGYSTNGSNIKIAAYWLSGSRHDLSPIDDTKNSCCYSIAVSGSNVYAAGYITGSSGKKIAGYWLNGNWHGLASTSVVRDTCCTSIVVSADGSDVYAGGYDGTASSQVAGYWKNDAWVDCSPPDDFGTSAVTAMVLIE